MVPMVLLDKMVFNSFRVHPLPSPSPTTLMASCTICHRCIMGCHFAFAVKCNKYDKINAVYMYLLCQELDPQTRCRLNTAPNF